MYKDLFKSHVHLGSFLLRLGLAGIFIFHGYLKVVQDNGAGWHPTLTEATQLAVTWGELTCGFCFLIGLFSRLAALGTAIIQVGAIVVQTGRLDFINTDFIRSFQGSGPTGWEYNFALIIMSAAVLAIGSGKVSADYLLFGSKEPAPPSSGAA
jgi:uncharacterized membrane protein YphA (DoxX/SURF4 family)